MFIIELPLGIVLVSISALGVEPLSEVEVSTGSNTSVESLERGLPAASCRGLDITKCVPPWLPERALKAGLTSHIPSIARDLNSIKVSFLQ
jgi:hypothetical protein